MRKPRNPLQLTIRSKYLTHANHVGRVALAWSALHERLGELFVTICEPNSITLARAIWHSIKNDRMQRETLLAAPHAVRTEETKLVKEIEWANGQIKGQLEDSRNTAVHAPYAMIFDSGGLKIIPEHHHGNPRAKQLKDKDLRAELKSYRDNIYAMTKFVKALDACVGETDDEVAWPDRPRLRRIAQSVNHGSTPRKKRNKSHRRPPQSSRA